MLIKSKNLARYPALRKIVPFEAGEVTKQAQLEIHKARQEAKAIRQEAEKVLEESKRSLADAEEKSKEVVRSANAQAEEIKKRTYEETLQVAKAEAEQIKTEARQLLAELFEVKRKALTEAHKDIIKVALDLAEKIIKYQVSIDTNILKTQVIEAIKRATTEADRVQVYVNPQDLNLLLKTIPELEKLFPSGIEIVPLVDDSVDQGSCIVETKSGQLDASFSTQLATLRNLLTKLEIKEPEISEVSLITSGEAELQTKEPEIKQQEELLQEEEKEALKEELLNDEPLIQMQEEEKFPFTSVAEDKVLEIPEEITKKVKEQGGLKKKLTSGDLIKRTKEEMEELDERLEYEEEEEEKEETPKPKSILRPKKQPSAGKVSEIASELEKSSEWKDLLQDEDEE